MKTLPCVTSVVAAIALLSVSIPFDVRAGMAEHMNRSRDGGVDVITYPMGVKDVVTVVGSLPAGDYFGTLNGGNPSVPTLTGLMLDKGTLRQDRFSLAKQLDDVGAQLQYQVDVQQLSIQGKALKVDIPRLIRILAEELREPAFSPTEFEKAKKQLSGLLREALDEVNAQAEGHLMHSAFRAGHPNHPVSLEEMLAAVDRATLEEVKAFYAKYYGPEHFNLIFTGDVNNKAIRAAVSSAFAGWRGGVDYVRSIASVPPPVGGGSVDVNLPDKASVTLIAGEATGLRFSDADSLALRVGTAILGSGFTGRLMSAVREKEGLTYGISASVGSDEFVDGRFMIQATFAPTLLDRGVSSTRRELQRWRNDGVTADELAERKSNLIGGFQTNLSTTAGMARNIQFMILRNEPLTWLDDYPRAIEALTLQRVNDAISRYIDIDRMVWVKAGTLSGTPQSAPQTPGG
jgi:zinc protease